MKPFLVHLHLYYTEMWPELREKLDSISGYAYDLHITLVQKNKELEEQILAYKNEAFIQIVENNGFDIGPFVYVINQVNLDDYSYVIKLHTKRKVDDPSAHVNHFDMTGTKWKECLLEFLSSKEIFTQYLNYIERENKVGMLAHYKLIVDSKRDSKTIKKIIPAIYEKYNLENIPYKFIGGTMFIARTSVFRRLQALNIKIDDFEPASGRVRDGQLAHKLERVLGLITYLDGYTIEDPTRLKVYQFINYFLARNKNFFYENHVTQSGKHIIKICKIPLWYRKISDYKIEK